MSDITIAIFITLLIVVPIIIFIVGIKIGIRSGFILSQYYKNWEEYKEKGISPWGNLF